MKNTMKNTMKVTVKVNSCGFTGIVSMPNLQDSSLEKRDGDIYYGTISNLRQAAKKVAKKYNCDLDFVEPVRMAAKKTAK